MTPAASLYRQRIGRRADRAGDRDRRRHEHEFVDAVGSAILGEILDVERSVRWKTNATSDNKHHDAPSHAFILFSNARTVVRADTVPLAIALWRVRMWEGEGFEESKWHAKE